MATVKAVTVVEQNGNRAGGVQFETAVFGTAAGACVFRNGRDGPTIVIAGTQTAVALQVVLELANAAHGDSLVIKRGTQGNSTSVLSIVSGSFGGAVIGQLSSSVQGNVIATFDGFAQAWR